MHQAYAAPVKLDPSLADLNVQVAVTHAKHAVVLISVIHAKMDWSRMLQAYAAPVTLDPSATDLIAPNATSHAKLAVVIISVIHAKMDW